MKEEEAPITEADSLNAAHDLRAALINHDIGMLRSLGICIPVCVYSYDSSTNIVTVMPLVKQAYYQGKWNYKKNECIFKVPVRNIQHGGFTIKMPIFVGDTGWVFSSDRDTKLLRQDGALTNSVLEGNRQTAIIENDYQQKPNTPTLHSFVHGFFIPDNWGSFETRRYKDNPDIAVGEGLYIGSSIDTDDQRDDVNEKKFQHGDAYEKKTTSSLVLLSGGGASLASSSDKETNQKAHVVVDRNKVETMAEDRAREKSSSLVLDTDNGITIRQDDEENRRHFVCSVNNGSFLMRMLEGDKIMSFSFIDGKLNVSTTDEVNVNFGGNTNFRCSGDVNVTGEKNMNVHVQGDMNAMVSGDARVTTPNARVVAEKTASVSAETISATALKTANVNAGETVNVGAVKTTNINAGETVNLAAGKKINVTAPEEVTIVTASKTTVMAKKKAAQILVTTLSKDSTIDVVAEGKSTKLNVTMKGKESPISITTEKEKSPISIVSQGNESSIQIESQGSKSDIKLSAANNVSIEAKKDAALTAGGNIQVAAKGKVEVSGSKIIENGTVEINGKLSLNNQSFGIVEQNKVKYWIVS
jgi:hypothetical protein